MSRHEEFVQHIDQIFKLTMETLYRFSAKMQKEKFAILETMEADLEKYKQTGVLPFSCVIAAEKTKATIEELTKPKGTRCAEQDTNFVDTSNSSKEPNPDRPRATSGRNACMEASHVVATIEKRTKKFFKKHSEIANIPIKQEKPDVTTSPTEVSIRQTGNRRDVRAIVAENSNLESVRVKEELINTESTERKAKPVRSGKPSTTSRNSDVLLPVQSVETINLAETDEEDSETPRKTIGTSKSKGNLQKKETTSSGSEQKTETEVARPICIARIKANTAGKNKYTENEQDSPIETQKQVRSSCPEVDDKQKKIGKRPKAQNIHISTLADAEIFQKIQAENEQANEVEPQPSRVINETFLLSKPEVVGPAKRINEESAKVDARGENIPNYATAGAVPKLRIYIRTDPKMKISQAEFREHDMRHKQNEAEASAKGALIQPQAEERQRNREERQRKVKSREETAGKTAPVMKKAPEEKPKQEEKKKLEDAMDMKEREMKIAPYLKYKPPLLPTRDCYDSNDPNKTKAYLKPHWQRKAVLSKTLSCMRYVCFQIHHLFCNGSKTANLQELFPSIEPHKLKRTSSAIWNKSGLSTLTVMDEEDGYDARGENIPNYATAGAVPKLRIYIRTDPKVKISQAEFREHDMRHKQNEAEALAKGALIQAQAEERQRNREERQRKVKSREETAGKTAQVMEKAAEEKPKQEEKKKLEDAMDMKEREMKIAPYLKYKPPLLPTRDCYDSNDPNKTKAHLKPHWQRKAVLSKTLSCMRYVCFQIHHLFCNGSKTANLQELFPSIEPHKLKRTSSAIWNKSGLSTLTVMDEEDGYVSA